MKLFLFNFYTIFLLVGIKIGVAYALETELHKAKEIYESKYKVCYVK